MNVKTSELTGAALDWAVAYALNGEPVFFKAFGAHMLGKSITGAVLACNIYPSTSWSQGGPLIDTFNVDFSTQGVDEDGSQLIEATVQYFESMECWAAEGDTRLQAMCRAIVLSKLGEWVDVPAALLAATGERI